MRRIIISFSILFMLFALITSSHAASYPVKFKDFAGNSFTISKKPTAVVSLIPSVTEMICALNSQDSLVGITYHDSRLSGVDGKKIVGGYFSPSFKIIKELQPDLLIAASSHLKSSGSSKLPEDICALKRICKSSCQIVVMDTVKMADYASNLRLLGEIFDCKEKAEEIIKSNEKQIEIIKQKVSKIPIEKRKRVIRLMGRDTIMSPGDDSFQNKMIEAAGGIAPKFGKTGDIISISKEEWQKFNPQVIYGCGQDRDTAEVFFSKPEWKDVEAVQKRQIYFFPCDLTCRASTHTGYFISWLAGTIYADEFGESINTVQPESIISTKTVDINLPYVKNAVIAYSNIYDFTNKSLLINFTTPQTIFSTLEGQRSNITTVGNHYSPPPSWNIDHKKGLKLFRKKVFDVVGLSQESASLLFTGADMDNLVIRQAKFKEIEVTALVTAGVESNAQRMSKDSGDFYEPDCKSAKFRKSSTSSSVIKQKQDKQSKPGTINILILTNKLLTPSAMSRAIITATEAKIAALWDMDIRSSYTSSANPATGTGTDNILVVQGAVSTTEGNGNLKDNTSANLIEETHGSDPLHTNTIENTSGHAKTGELIASAVYAGVKEAILKQNGFAPVRDVFQRLKERKISIYELASSADCQCSFSKSVLAGEVEKTFLDSRWSGYMEAAFSISDAYERGQIGNIESFQQWSCKTASDIAGEDIVTIKDMITNNEIPVVLKTALNAVFTGVQAKLGK